MIPGQASVEAALAAGTWDWREAHAYLMEYHWPEIGRAASCHMGDNEYLGGATSDMVAQLEQMLLECTDIEDVAAVLKWLEEACE
jgi:hypothetical protein